MVGFGVLHAKMFFTRPWSTSEVTTFRDPPSIATWLEDHHVMSGCMNMFLDMTPLFSGLSMPKLSLTCSTTQMSNATDNAAALQLRNAVEQCSCVY